MIRSFLHGLTMKSASHRQRSRGRRARRLWRLEGLEDRVLLANNPTIYTVDFTSDTGMGTGNAGDLLYVINQANANPNPAGSEIEFSTPQFSTPQSIALTSTLELSGSGGPITIDGPGANYGPVTIAGSGEFYAITLALPISRPDRVTIVIAGAGLATYTRRLDVLAGDANDDGVVNKSDANSVLNQARGVTPATIFGDVLGDGTVDGKDYHAVRKLEGKPYSRLPKVSLPVLGRSLPRERLAMEHHRH